MDLGKAFAVDEKRRDDGVWFRLYDRALVPIDKLPPTPADLGELPSGEKLAEFRIRSAECEAAQTLIGALSSEYRAVLIPGHKLQQAATREIEARVAGEVYLADWRYVELHGQTVEYSRDASVALMREMPGLRTLIQLVAHSPEAFKPSIPNLLGDEAGKKTS